MKICFKKTDIDLVSCRKITLCLHMHGVINQNGKLGPLWFHMWGVVAHLCAQEALVCSLYTF